MLHQLRFNKFISLIFLSLICFFGCNVSFYAQTKDSQNQERIEPVSVCEILQNKSKYKNKEIAVKGVVQISAETSTFITLEDCPNYEIIAIGENNSFQSVNDSETLELYERETDLYSAIQNNTIGLNKNNIFAGAIKVEISASGILQISRKKIFGHLNQYKLLFLFTKLKQVGKSVLID